jgi:hypothetical protein
MEAATFHLVITVLFDHRRNLRLLPVTGIGPKENYYQHPLPTITNQGAFNLLPDK